MNRIEIGRLSFEKRLKYFREKKGMTQNELAKISDVLITNIRKYETGVRIPKADTIRKLAIALDVSVFDLLELECNSKEDVLAIISQPQIMNFLTGALVDLRKDIDEEIDYHSSLVNDLTIVKEEIVDLELKEKRGD